MPAGVCGGGPCAGRVADDAAVAGGLKLKVGEAVAGGHKVGEAVAGVFTVSYYCGRQGE